MMIELFAESIAAVGTQVAALFAMSALGFVLYKKNLIGDTGIAHMTNLLLWGVTPCLLVEAFSRDFSAEMAVSLLVVAVFGSVAMLLTLAAGLLIFRNRPVEIKGVLSFASAFSNCGFMGLPLANALYGEEGVMYASAFVIAFNLTQWTAGCAVMSGGKIDPKKLLINPGILGLVISLPVFLFSIKIPDMIMSPVSSVAGMNTPLAMTVIGGFLAKADFRNALRSKSVYTVALIRLIAVPVLTLLPLRVIPLPINHTAAVTLLAELAAPVAASTVMIASLTNRDAELAGQTVAVTTLLSAITMPLVVTAGEVFFN